MAVEPEPPAVAEEVPVAPPELVILDGDRFTLQGDSGCVGAITVSGVTLTGLDLSGTNIQISGKRRDARTSENYISLSADTTFLHIKSVLTPTEVSECGEITVTGESVYPAPPVLDWDGTVTLATSKYEFTFNGFQHLPDTDMAPVPLTADRIDGLLILAPLKAIDGIILMRLPDCDSSRDCEAWHVNPGYEPSWYGLDEFFSHTNEHLEKHYHRVSDAMIEPATTYLRQVGMAADGYPIVTGWFDDGGLVRRATSSYQLRVGNRPAPEEPFTAPTGPYTGEFVEDYEYVEGSGDLDECNGMVINGVYSYFITADFPYVMNCLRGTPDDSFLIGSP